MPAKLPYFVDFKTVFLARVPEVYCFHNRRTNLDCLRPTLVHNRSVPGSFVAECCTPAALVLLVVPDCTACKPPFLAAVRPMTLRVPAGQAKRSWECPLILRTLQRIPIGLGIGAQISQQLQPIRAIRDSLSLRLGKP